MSFKKTILILALAPSLAVGAVATAQVVTPQDITLSGPQGDAQVVQVQDRRGGKERGDRDGRGGGLRGMMPGSFEEMDTDGDGALTQAEIDAFIDARLASADTDGTPGLSVDEFRALFAEVTEERRDRAAVRGFQRLDADASGTITAAELDGRFGAIVERMDRNGDGALTREDGGRRGNR